MKLLLILYPILIRNHKMNSEEILSPSQSGLPLPLSLLCLGILKPSLSLSGSTVRPPSLRASLPHSCTWDLGPAEWGFTEHPFFQGITNAAMFSVLKSSSALIMSLGGHVVLNCPYTAQLHQNVSGCWAFPWFSVSHELMRNSILWFPRWRTPVLPRPPQRGAEPFNPSEGLCIACTLGPLKDSVFV